MSPLDFWRRRHSSNMATNLALDVITMDLKIELSCPCEGCFGKIKKNISKMDGVKAVSVDIGRELIRVKSIINPEELVRSIEKELKKNVKVVSLKKKERKDNDGSKSEITVDLKIELSCPCEGCFGKIKKKISKMDGVKAVSVNIGRELVRVKSIMNVEVLVDSIKEKLKKNVEVVSPKKDAGEKKEREDNIENHERYTNRYAEYVYQNQGYGLMANHPVHMFSDENTNACSVM